MKKMRQGHAAPMSSGGIWSVMIEAVTNRVNRMKALALIGMSCLLLGSGPDIQKMNVKQLRSLAIQQQERITELETENAALRAVVPPNTAIPKVATARGSYLPVEHPELFKNRQIIRCQLLDLTRMPQPGADSAEPWRVQRWRVQVRAINASDATLVQTFLTPIVENASILVPAVSGSSTDYRVGELEPGGSEVFWFVIAAQANVEVRPHDLRIIASNIDSR